MIITLTTWSKGSLPLASRLPHYRYQSQILSARLEYCIRPLLCVQLGWLSASVDVVGVLAGLRMFELGSSFVLMPKQSPHHRPSSSITAHRSKADTNYQQHRRTQVWLRGHNLLRFFGFLFHVIRLKIDRIIGVDSSTIFGKQFQFYHIYDGRDKRLEVSDAELHSLCLLFITASYPVQSIHNHFHFIHRAYETAATQNTRSLGTTTLTQRRVQTRHSADARDPLSRSMPTAERPSKVETLDGSSHIIFLGTDDIGTLNE